jgi:hypothetical protein
MADKFIRERCRRSDNLLSGGNRGHNCVGHGHGTHIEPLLPQVVSCHLCGALYQFIRRLSNVRPSLELALILTPFVTINFRRRNDIAQTEVFDTPCHSYEKRMRWIDYRGKNVSDM